MGVPVITKSVLLRIEIVIRGHLSRHKTNGRVDAKNEGMSSINSYARVKHRSALSVKSNALLLIQSSWVVFGAIISHQ